MPATRQSRETAEQRRVENKVADYVRTLQAQGATLSTIADKVFQRFGYLVRRVNERQIVLNGKGGSDWIIRLKEENMPAKKARRKITKAPSPAQIRVRKAFAAAAKARAKAEKKKAAKTPRRRNKTIITKPRKVVVINKLNRLAQQNPYMDLVIKGFAEKTPQGWRIGKKTIPQGKGTVSISSSYRLDRATGAVYAKRARNVAQGYFDSFGFHPIRSSPDYDEGRVGTHTRSKKKKAATKKAARTWKDKAETRQRKSTTSRLAGRSLRGSGGILKGSGSQRQRRANPRQASPAVKKIRESFTGVPSRKTSIMHVPEGTPKDLAKLGKLSLIKLRNGRTLNARKGVTFWLCADANGKMHIASTKPAAARNPLMKDNYGEVMEVEYLERKPHLGYKKKTLFFHKLGEENGKRPMLISDGQYLKFKGGDYRITSRGIVN